MPTFRGKVESPDGKGSQSFVVLPAGLVAELGRGKKPPIKLTLKGYTLRTTVFASGDQYLVPVRREVREAAGIVFDEPIEITVELDSEERSVSVPPDLASIFDAEPDLREAFDRLSFTARKEIVDSLTSAKRPETRQQRRERALDRLRHP